MSWHASWLMNHSARAGKTATLFEYSGPRRILQSLYPESDGIFRNVIVHPTGGPVGGDTLDLCFKAAARAHGLVTAPGVTRFYRSDGAPALPRTQPELGRRYPAQVGAPGNDCLQRLPV